jgi:hypothetical protein
VQAHEAALVAAKEPEVSHASCGRCVWL